MREWREIFGVELDAQGVETLGGFIVFSLGRLPDEGDVVRRREVEVRRGDTYEDLCYKTLVMAGTLMTEAVRRTLERS